MSIEWLIICLQHNQVHIHKLPRVLLCTTHLNKQRTFNLLYCIFVYFKSTKIQYNKLKVLCLVKRCNNNCRESKTQKGECSEQFTLAAIKLLAAAQFSANLLLMKVHNYWLANMNSKATNALFCDKLFERDCYMDENVIQSKFYSKCWI